MSTNSEYDNNISTYNRLLQKFEIVYIKYHI